mgnify:CR=1 FL=1
MGTLAVRAALATLEVPEALEALVTLASPGRKS